MWQNRRQRWRKQKLEIKFLKRNMESGRHLEGVIWKVVDQGLVLDLTKGEDLMMIGDGRSGQIQFHFPNLRNQNIQTQTFLLKIKSFRVNIMKLILKLHLLKIMSIQTFKENKSKKLPLHLICINMYKNHFQKANSNQINNNLTPLKVNFKGQFSTHRLLCLKIIG